ncbi:hypothetical protein Tco_0398376 [Tanacetum coccineum]
MSNLKFAETHNLVAFLEKPKESDGFEGIIDFLNASSIRYALTVNPTIYTSCIKQFWATAKAKTVNGEVQIQALVDGKKVIITETSNLEGGVKFLMYPRFVQVFLDKQVEGMTKHKEIYVTPSHTKKVFANMKREGKGFSGRVTPLFQTMMVQAPEELEPITDEAANEEHVPIHSNDPLLSGEDRLKLNELMELCTNLSQRFLDLENTNTSQAAEITKLNERVKKLERRNKSGTSGLKRLRKVGRTARIESSKDEGLGAQEDASKQGRKIADLDADAEEVEVEKVVSTAEVTTASATTTTVDELTLAQTLIEIKAAKPKAVTTAATTTTTAVTRPKARGVVVQEPSEFRTTTSSSQTSQLPQVKDKGKAKMIEPEKPLKKKDQILVDEEIAQRLQEELQAELEEEERLARQKEEEDNLISWDNTQAMMEADYELAQRLQAEEQGELTIEERSKLFVELMDKRKKHFAKLRAEEIRRKPPTKAQKRNQMCTYLKNMANYKHSQLKNKSFEEIQMLFDNTMKWVDSFVPMDSEVVEGSKSQAEGSKKRTRKELDEESVKRQKLEDDAEKAELKACLEIVPGDAVTIESLATKYPIVDWKTHILAEDKMYYQIIRADGSAKFYKIFSAMLDDFDRQDVLDLYRLVKERFETTSPEGYDRLLWGDLITLFEPSEEDEIWKAQQDYTLISWRLYDSCGVHLLLMDTGITIHMMVEKKYPLTQEMLSRMLSGKLEVDHECEMAYELLRFTKSRYKK